MIINRNYWIRLIVFSFFVSSFSIAAPKGEKNLEEVFFDLSKRPRLLDNEWLEKVSAVKNKSYRIKKGDSLWKVSKKLFHDPFLWRKLWETNPSLANPHELDIGTNLKYSSPSRSLASFEEVIKIPLVRLKPNQKNSATSVENDSIVNVDFKNRFIPNLFLLTEEEIIYGEVTGSFSRKETPGPLESLFVNISHDGVQVGDVFSVVQELTKVNPFFEGEGSQTSKIMKLVGEVRLLEKEEKLWKVDLRTLYGNLKRGDKLIALQKPTEWALFYDPPSEMQTRVLSGEDPERSIFVQGDILLLDKGKKDGMQEGFVFKVWQDRDSLLGEEKTVEPESKGEVRVIHVSADSSIGYILKNFDPIELGDVLVPRQAFTDFRPRFRREVQTLELQ